MGAVNTSYTFTVNDTITSTKMNDIIDQTTMTGDSILGTTLEVSSGKLKIRSQGITNSELGVGSVTTTAIQDNSVTPIKLSNSDFGDFTVSSGVATIDANAVTFTKLAAAAVATVAEVKAETASKLVTADNVKQSPPSAKAYGSFTTTISTRTLSGSYNVSVTRLTASTSQVTFTASMASAAYSVVAQTTNSGVTSGTGIDIDANPIVYDKQSTGFKIQHQSESTNRAVDFVVFGTLA
jgi:hypothetical protein